MNKSERIEPCAGISTTQQSSGKSNAADSENNGLITMECHVCLPKHFSLAQDQYPTGIRQAHVEYQLTLGPLIGTKFLRQ